MAADPNPGQVALTGDPRIAEAKERFNYCAEWESSARQRFFSDIKFRHGDSDNGYQWPNALRAARDLGNKPCLTMNVIRQHNLQIVNEAKRHKSAIKVQALGGGATVESAKAVRQLIRHTEYISNAQAAYKVAREFQVDGGIGYWRIITDFEDDDTFNVDAFICEVNDPMKVYLDPDIQKRDGHDANFGFFFDTMPRKTFQERFEKYKDLAGQAPLGVGTTDNLWPAKDDVLVCEYFRKVEKPDQLISFFDSGSGKRKEIRKSKLKFTVEQLGQILDDPLTKTRETKTTTVEWLLIAGETVIDETVWPGSFVPIIRCIGEESVIGGVLDRKGHTRAMKDAQRMYNYNASAQVEFVALQGKTPWVAPAKAVEEFETMWNTANTANHSVLIYNSVDDEGNPIEAPKRTEPPTASPAYQAGMETSFNQMMMTSGQWQNSMGMMGNERTGRAIEGRKEQSDTSVFHFEDNFGDAIRLTGKMLIELYSKIYDTKRVKRILAEDGTEYEIEIDPSAKQAYIQHEDQEEKVFRRVLNPTLGKYDIAADVGPDYGTKRQETVDALTLILTQNPGLTAIVGDILLNALDFDEAQEAAQRLKRMIPPQALGKGPSPQEQQMQQQITTLKQALAKSLQAHGADHLKLVGKAEARDIEAYSAETARMAALSKLLPEDGEGLMAILRQLVEDALHTTLTSVLSANSGELAEQSVEGPVGLGSSSEQPSGEWTMTDPTRRLRLTRFAPLLQERKANNIMANK